MYICNMSIDIKENRLSKDWGNLLAAFIGENHNDWVIAKEKGIEKAIIELLSHIGIRAIVKTDRYSLPYTHSVSVSNGQSSYIPDIYDTTMLRRKLLKEVIDMNTNKIRFYVYIHTTDGIGEGFKNIFTRKFNIEIRFYPH